MPAEGLGGWVEESGSVQLPFASCLFYLQLIGLVPLHAVGSPSSLAVLPAHLTLLTAPAPSRLIRSSEDNLSHCKSMASVDSTICNLFQKSKP